VIVGAKISRTTFYRLLADREDRFVEVVAHEWARARSLAVTAYEQKSDWCDGLRVALGAILADMDRRHSLARLCIVDAPTAGPRMVRLIAEMRRELARALDIAASSSGTVRTSPSSPPRRSFHASSGFFRCGCSTARNRSRLCSGRS
jgi:AcrR family transcriptional regulator